MVKEHKPNICVVCEKEFDRLDKLNKHYYKCLRNNIVCDHCPARLSNKKSLANHMRTFHGSKDERRFMNKLQISKN